MSIATYDPKKVDPKKIIPVSFTDKALDHLSKQVALKNAKGIAFKVKASGCSGFKYLLELAAEIDATDIHFRLKNDLDLYVQPEAIPLISGTQVDYQQQGVNFQLSFNNPNATALCGCGESFSVDPQ